MADASEILSGMLGAVSPAYDKRPGSFIFDALAPAAEQLAKTDESINLVKEKLSIENLSGDELEQRVKERTGTSRKQATKSIGTAMLTGTGTIQIGDRFETVGGVQFQSLETKMISGSGTVAIEAVVAGSFGNVPADTISLFPVTLAGFTAVTNPAPTDDGFDAESDADLLQRYYELIRTPATSGNKAHYRNWTKEVSGVGDARVIPLWNGDNTVKVIIIDSDKTPASAAIVEDVQAYIDPGSDGLGEGQAPIGAYATVVSASGVAIDVSAKVTLSSGTTEQEGADRIREALTAFLREIAFVEPFVSYAKVGAKILDSPGIADYAELLLNGGTVNIPIADDQVAVLGTVTIHVT